VRQNPIVTLTTDFGTSPYVGQLKGCLLSNCPSAQIVDISHDIRPQSVIHGATVLQDSVPYFPPGSIHIAVVDPGVGTDRSLVVAEIGPWLVLGPDNGLLSSLASDWPIGRIIRLANPEYWNRKVSKTFHGRDILAPVAGQLANGVALEKFGPQHRELSPNPVPRTVTTAHSISGQILFSDHYGNLITNIPLDDFPTHAPEDILRVFISGKERCPFPRRMIPWVKTYADAQHGELVALVGSSGRVEVSVVNGNASRRIGSEDIDVSIEFERAIAL